jgi:SAM-dependent methyltransferase
VTSLAVIEHIEPEKVLPLICEIRRVLKPDGLFILTTPAAWADKLLKFMAMLGLASPVEIAEHKNLYTTSKIKSMLSISGFSQNSVKSGYFECFANIWATAQK